MSLKISATIGKHIRALALVLAPALKIMASLRQGKRAFTGGNMKKRVLTGDKFQYREQDVALRNKFLLTHTPTLDVQVKLAETPIEYFQAFKLIHKRYKDRSLVNSENESIKMLKQHMMPTSLLLVAVANERVVGTITIVVDGPMGLPSDEILDLSLARQKYRRLVEASCFAIESSEDFSTPEIMGPIYRAFFDFSTRFLGADALVASVHPRRWDFYRAVWNFDLLCEETKSYEAVNGAPAIGILSEIDRDKFQNWVQTAEGSHPEGQTLQEYFFGEVSPNRYLYPEKQYRQAFEAKIDVDTLLNFAINNTKLLDQMSPRDLVALWNTYLNTGIPGVMAAKDKLAYDRVAPRYTVYCPLRGFVKGEAKMISGHALEVSAYGLMISTSESFTKNQVLNLKVELNDKVTSQITGRVAWVAGNKCGLELLNSDALLGGMIVDFEKQMKHSDNIHQQIQNSRAKLSSE